MILCQICRKEIPFTALAHYDRRDPTIKFCSAHCFYENYISQGPKTPFDLEIVWPLFEVLHFNKETQINLLCCYDDFAHYVAARGRLLIETLFYNRTLQKYRLTSFEYVLIVLLAQLTRVPG
jgi:hypothetical protein